MTDLTVLGQTVTEPLDYLEGFPTPVGFNGIVRLESTEFTALCPVTGQPDFCNVTIEYRPGDLCIESKSLKLFLLGFRQSGAFCEQLAVTIANVVFRDISPEFVRVNVDQAPRGGISIHASHLIERQGTS